MSLLWQRLSGETSDVELIRKILFAVEESSTNGLVPFRLSIDGCGDIEIGYNVRLLHEAGLLIAKDTNRTDHIFWDPVRLTWDGHELLDAMRSDEGWGKAQKAMTQIGGFTIDVLKSLLVEYLKQEGRRFLGG